MQERNAITRAAKSECVCRHMLQTNTTNKASYSPSDAKRGLFINLVSSQLPTVFTLCFHLAFPSPSPFSASQGLHQTRKMGNPEFMRLVNWQVQAMFHAQSRKGLHPGKAPPREEVIKEFMAQREKVSKLSPDRLRFSLSPPAYPPCTRPLSELKKAMLNDLLLETHHRDSYLLLRSVTPSYRDNAVFSIVEDEKEDVMLLELYYKDRQRDVEDIVKEGTVLVVKEPYIRPNANGGHGVRVDHLSDLIRLPEYDERIPDAWRSDGSNVQLSADSWKAKGNEYFNSRKYDNAIDCYTRGLDCSPTADEIRALNSNHSIAFIKTKQFAAALADADPAIAATGPTEKALTRKVPALYHIERFRECCEILKGLLEENSSNTAVQNELTRATERLTEQETGSYQFKKLHAAANKLRPPLLDHATHIGPVAIKEAEAYGRGLFTTKDVKAGDLPLCEKAFGYAFAGPEHKRDVAMIINMGTNQQWFGTQTELIRAIAQKMYANPSLTSAITDLHAGVYESVDVAEVDGKPVVDTFLIERIVDANAFGCAPSAVQDHFEETLYAREGVAVNKDKYTYHSCGVWPTTSHINHSCYSSTHRSITGDMLTLRATQDIPANTEATISYKPPVPDFDEERIRFRNWGFICRCVLCEDDHGTYKGIHDFRKDLHKAALVYIRRSSASNATSKLESIATSLADTYTQSAAKAPRIILSNLLFDLARIYLRKKQPGNAVTAALRTFQALGYAIEGGSPDTETDTPLVVKRWGLFQNSLIECWIILVLAYRDLAKPGLPGYAEMYAKMSYKMSVGEDESFDETYEQHIRSGAARLFA